MTLTLLIRVFDGIERIAEILFMCSVFKECPRTFLSGRLAAHKVIGQMVVTGVVCAKVVFKIHPSEFATAHTFTSFMKVTMSNTINKWPITLDEKCPNRFLRLFLPYGSLGSCLVLVQDCFQQCTICSPGRMIFFSTMGPDFFFSLFFLLL